MKNKILTIILIAVTLGSLMSCKKNTGPASETIDTNSMADFEFKYDPHKVFNNGDPLEIEFWTWDSIDLFRQLGDEYMATHANVKIKFVQHPWNDFWTKLPLALKAGRGPALFNFHNSQQENLLQYMAPYQIHLDQLKEQYRGVDSHIIDGKLYYTDYGFMTGSIYYNKKLWAEAGLSEHDIPGTWSEFRIVAKKLTKYGADQKIIQAGFNYNKMYQAIIEGLNYQKGSLLFAEDKKTVNFNNPTTIENTQFLVDLYEVDRVGSKDFGIDQNESFGQEKTAMIYAWGWFKNYLVQNFPTLEWGVFNIPIPEKGKVPFAYDRNNGESSFGINKNAPLQQQAVAQDFIKFFLLNDEMLKKFNLGLGTFPAKKSLAGDEEIVNDVLLKELSQIIDRTIWPGVIPVPIEQNLKKTIEDIMYNGMSVSDAVKKTQTMLDRDLRGSTFISVEDKYQYYHEISQ